jgi:hypothetical protein
MLSLLLLLRFAEDTANYAYSDFLEQPTASMDPISSS